MSSATTVLSLSDFQLKAVKTFQGMEGQGFTANLYVCGKKAAFVRDDAHGGELWFEWVDSKPRSTPPQDVAEFLKSDEAKAIGRAEWEHSKKKHGWSGDFAEKREAELEIGISQEDFVEYLLKEKTKDDGLKKMAKKYGFVFRYEDDPETEMRAFRYPKGYKWTQAIVDKIVADEEKETGKKVVVLNNPSK